MAKGTCTIPGCAKREQSRGWCTMHYTRWKRHGDPLFKKRLLYEPLEVQFWAKVDQQGPPPPDGDHLGPCWTWKAAIASTGYGKLGPRYAHRVAYELLVGPIPPGLYLDHLCRNRACVNPAHLEPVSPHENLRRGVAGGATSCPSRTLPHGKRRPPISPPSSPGTRTPLVPRWLGGASGRLTTCRWPGRCERRRRRGA